jgi:alkylation response protein AidB-like acyl-CoA dehydrogenase
VTATREVAISLEPLTDLRLEGVAVPADDVVGDPAAGAGALNALVDRTIAALCWTALGVCEGALALTASYVSEREQFGTKIGTFQAVAQRAADAYIDTEAVRLTAWQAAWRLSVGLPADEALAVAKFWAAEGGQRVVHAAQHLHGGIGVDVDYPLHRYYRWAKVLELTLGGAAMSLLRLGDVLARPAGV